MRIRTQFVALVVSLILVPVLLLGIGAALWFLTKAEISLPGYEELSSGARQATTQQTWDSLRETFGMVPRGNDYYIFSEDFRLLYTSAARSPFVEGKPASSDQVMGLLRQTGMTRDVGLVNLPESRLWVAIVVSPDSGFDWTVAPLLVAGLALVFILIVAIVAAILMARSSTRAIVQLEKAVRRVGDGDLETTVEPIRGNDEIESLGRTFDQVRRTLKEDTARRSRFVMGISHDLKTPVALIRGYAELLRDGTIAPPEETQDHWEVILGKVNQLDDMIDHLIESSKLDTGEWQQTWSEFSLKGFLEDFSAGMAAVARFSGLSLVTDLNLPPELTVRGDLRSVGRSLENLVNNALRYNRTGGTVGLEARVVPGFAEVTVWDDGPGIAPDDLPHLFELFYRGSQSRREPGMGLGLSIVKTILDSHGWSIRAESRNGARFVVRIPLEGA